MTVPRLNLVAVVEVDEADASPGEVSAGGDGSGHDDDGEAVTATFGCGF